MRGLLERVASGAPESPRKLTTDTTNYDAPLQRLRRERPSQGAHQQGSLPPAAVFPATRSAATNLTAASLAALADFYGEQFGQPGAYVAARREAFLDFIGA